MKVLVNESSLENIANAIRSKNGDTAKYKPSEMSSAISNITTTISPNYTVKFDSVNKKTISLDWLRTNNMTSMNSMFYNCSSLTSLDLSNFDTSNVNNMNAMFYGCNKLTSLDLSNFNTSKVTVVVDMFYGCSKLASLDLSSFNTSNVTSMHEMFRGCSSLTSLDLSNFDTSNVTIMYGMFIGCSALKTLDIRNFTFAQLKDGKNFNWGIFGETYGSDTRIPADCKIIVKDDAVRNWIRSAKYATGWGSADYATYGDYFTNIKTVAEL